MKPTPSRGHAADPPAPGTARLGRVWGIPIRLHPSWFLVFGLVTWSLAGGYFPIEYPGWAIPTYWVVGAATALLFFVSIVLPELGHPWGAGAVARRAQDRAGRAPDEPRLGDGFRWRGGPGKRIRRANGDGNVARADQPHGGALQPAPRGFARLWADAGGREV